MSAGSATTARVSGPSRHRQRSWPSRSHVAPTGDSQTVTWVLGALAGTVAEAGEYEYAARLLGGAEDLRAKLDRHFDLPRASGVRDRRRALTKEAFGTVRLAELTDEGRRMPYADVITFALDAPN